MSFKRDRPTSTQINTFEQRASSFYFVKIDSTYCCHHHETTKRVIINNNCMGRRFFIRQKIASRHIQMRSEMMSRLAPIEMCRASNVWLIKMKNWVPKNMRNRCAKRLGHRSKAKTKKNRKKKNVSYRVSVERKIVASFEIEMMKIATKWNEMKYISANCSRIYDNYSHCKVSRFFSSLSLSLSNRFSAVIQPAKRQ